MTTFFFKNKPAKREKKKVLFFIMASLESFKAPTLVSKKTQKEIQKDDDEDDVLIDANAVPSSTSADADMEDAEDKPNFAPASAVEEKVLFYNI